MFVGICARAHTHAHAHSLLRDEYKNTREFGNPILTYHS